MSIISLVSVPGNPCALLSSASNHFFFLNVRSSWNVYFWRLELIFIIQKDYKLLLHVLTQILHKVESWKQSFLSSNAVDVLLLLYNTALWADVA